MLSLKASLPLILARQHNIFGCVIGESILTSTENTKVLPG
jgi:hypothetical protein